jgi:hypothetical protein
MKTKEKPSAHLTVEQYEQLAAAMFEDAAALPPGPNKRNNEAGRRLSQPCRNEELDIWQGQLRLNRIKLG